MNTGEAIGTLTFLKAQLQKEPEMKPVVEALQMAIDKLLTTFITEHLVGASEE